MSSSIPTRVRNQGHEYVHQMTRYKFQHTYEGSKLLEEYIPPAQYFRFQHTYEGSKLSPMTTYSAELISSSIPTRVRNRSSCVSRETRLGVPAYLRGFETSPSPRENFPTPPFQHTYEGSKLMYGEPRSEYDWEFQHTYEGSKLALEQTVPL